MASVRKWYPIVVVAATVVLSAIAYPRLPDRVPIHWNLHGQIDGYGSKLVATLMLPLVLLGLWGLLRLLPKIDPRVENYAKFETTYDLVVNCALTVVALTHCAFLADVFGIPISIMRVVPAAVGVLLIIIGNALPRVRPNWWFGIRTPWTLSNDRVWERTHRVSGYVFVALGVLALGALVLPIGITAPAMGVIGLAAALWSIGYSYYVYRQETSQ